MPRPYNAPLIIDNQFTLKIGFLSKNGVFKNNVKGTLSYKLRKGVLNLKIESVMEQYYECIILTYNDFKGNEVTQKIMVDSSPSNLGKGLVWFFICPFTFKRCRNLIFVNGRFMHRSNLVGALYQKQFEGKYWREYFKLMPNNPTVEKIINEPNTKHYKKYYNGKPTKRYKKWNATINKWNANIDKQNAMFNKKLAKIGFNVP